MIDLRNKRVTVMGLGVHGGGLGVARFLAQHGAHVTVTDLRSTDQLRSSIEALQDFDITYILGQHRDQDFTNTDMVVRNPGVPRESRYLQLAQAAAVPIEMEMTLFFRLCPAPIIGITGTKGKTTTTMLTGTILREWRADTVIAGNLRISALEQLPLITPSTPVVLELSSWQLEGLGEAQLSPAFACVTSFSPDHMDRYASLEAYAEAKQHIYLHQQADQLVLLPALSEFDGWAARAPGRVQRFAPQAAQEWPHPGLRGPHNTWNVAAAGLLAQARGAPAAQIATVIAAFKGVEHRMEWVRDVNGIQFINDTAATTPTAAAAAVASYATPIILIAGGANKNLAWEPLIAAIKHQPQLRGIILLEGTATAELKQALRLAANPYTSFEAAIQAAYMLAEPGDTVLLAPGAASFGMFQNEFQRGEEFRRIVKEL